MKSFRRPNNKSTTNNNHHHHTSHSSTRTTRMGALKAGAAGLISGTSRGRGRTGTASAPPSWLSSRSPPPVPTWNHNPTQSVASTALNERLEEVLVLELLQQDGGRNYLTLSVRSLYKHVLDAITTNNNTTNNNNTTTNNTNSTPASQVSAAVPGASTAAEAETTASGGNVLLSPVMEEDSTLSAFGSSSSSSAANRHLKSPVVGVGDRQQFRPGCPPGVSWLESNNFNNTTTTSTTSQQQQPNPEREIAFQAEEEETLPRPTPTPLPLSPSPTPPMMDMIPGGGGGGSGGARGGTGGVIPSVNHHTYHHKRSFGGGNGGGGGGGVARPRNIGRRVSVGGGGFGDDAGNNGGLATHYSSPGVTYRERLGGYLHPRDMRKLVTPFSASNEPELIVRRHAMLFNFDPLRCIILRDRLLVLVPDGADSILVDLERIVRGGKREMELACFGKELMTEAMMKEEEINMVQAASSTAAATDNNAAAAALPTAPPSSSKDAANQDNKRLWGKILQSIKTGKLDSLEHITSNTNNSGGGGGGGSDSDMAGTGHSNSKSRLLFRRSSSTGSTSDFNPLLPPRENAGAETTQSSNTGPDYPGGGGGGDYDHGDDDDSKDDLAAAEWDDIAGQAWIELPFELQCTDAVLQTVVGLLSEDTNELQQTTLAFIDQILNHQNNSSGAMYSTFGEDPLMVIRSIKDSVREMISRAKGFVQSMNTILDDYEDMALMNLSRLISHPERFIQPVPAEVLEEESDEPELILESYLQQGLSLINRLHLIQGQIDTAAELIDQKLDATRNKILMANTIISTVALSINFSTLVAGLFGMNVINHLEENESVFTKIVFWTIAGSFLLFCFTMTIMYHTGAIPHWGTVSSS